MKFGFSVIVDVSEQFDLQLIADALSALPKDKVRDVLLSTAHPLREKPAITADIVLSRPVEVGSTTAGTVYNDTAIHGNHPFRDGTYVNTSVVVAYEGDIITTRNSVYRVIQEPIDGEATASN